MKQAPVVVLAIVCAGINSHAQIEPQYQKDAAPSKDHNLTARIEGSVILRQTLKKFSDLTIPLERIVFDYSAQAFKPFNKLKPEGALTTTFYRLPKDASTLECIRAYQPELAKHGFEVLFEGSSGGSATGESNAIVQALVSRYGVEKPRLFPFGCSFASPAAPNTTDEGRAKNCRVELVRWN